MSIIIHVDMDAFFAAVEVRDNPCLCGKPLIIGALPQERGVVSTCNYEARKFGVRSAMNIKEAYKLCPNGIFMHPNIHKYKLVSDQMHKIWEEYTDIIEYISLDEGFLDVSWSAHLFGGAEKIALEIKEKTKEGLGLTCSVGIGYSMMSAKLASEEKKPDGFFVIDNADRLLDLIIDRDVKVIYGVGAQTAHLLYKAGINTVRDIHLNENRVASLLGNHGRQIVELAKGADERKVKVNSPPKSIGKEQTFSKDTTSFAYLKDVLLLISDYLSYDICNKGLCCSTITLKVTYGNMKQITRSITGEATDRAQDIYKAVSVMLDKLERRPVRLIGISLSGLAARNARQLSFLDTDKTEHKEKLLETMFSLKKKYGTKIIETGDVLAAKSRLNEKEREE